MFYVPRWRPGLTFERSPLWFAQRPLSCRTPRGGKGGKTSCRPGGPKQNRRGSFPLRFFPQRGKSLPLKGKTKGKQRQDNYVTTCPLGNRTRLLCPGWDNNKAFALCCPIGRSFALWATVAPLGQNQRGNVA